MKTKAEVMIELRNMIREVIAQSASGATQPRMAQSRGFADGYMRALLDLGVASQRQMLDLVASERERAGGPALRIVDPAALHGDTATA
jgi:hypothetical protein